MVSQDWDVKPVRRQLGNGIDVALTPLPHLQTAAISVAVKAGSRYETEQTRGLSHFLEHMVFRGTPRRPTSYAFNLAIENLGGTVYAATHADHTLYQLSLPSENFLAGLELFHDMFIAPQFSEIDAEKAIVREEILEELDEDGIDIDIDNVSRRGMFGVDPLGHTILGTTRHIDSFTHDDLQRHLERHYVGNNMTISVAGALDIEQTYARLDDLFSRISPGLRTETPSLATPSSTERWHYVENTGSQSDVRISFLTFGEHDERWPALQLLVRVLDDGLSTRLHRRICDDKGLAYHVFAGIDPYEDLGVFDIGASIEHTKAVDVISEILCLVHELRTEPVSNEEIERARRRYLWDVRMLRDDADGAATLFATQLLFHSNIILQPRSDRIMAVTVQDILDVAQFIFSSSRMHIAAVGLLNEPIQASIKQLISRF